MARFMILMALQATASLSLAAEKITLDPARMSHVTFEDIKPSVYKRDGDALAITVDRSASVMIKAFAERKTVSKVRFQWRSEGELKIRDAAMEETKKGDDAKLRVGLIVAGEAPTIPFFAPAWIKAVRDSLKLPSDRMIYLTVDSRHPPGASWANPYSDSITSIAVASKPAEGGWQASEYAFEKPVALVGLWLAADGDSSGSTFKSWLRELELE